MTPEHGPRCMCIPCGRKYGRILTAAQAAKMLGCGEERIRVLVYQGKLDRTIPSTAGEPEIFTDSLVELTARRQRRLPRTPEDQTMRWELSESRLRKTYGIESEDWARLYEAQGGRCPGCRRRLKHRATTHVDHCHRTRRVRGLLCRGCNTALGSAKDNPATLRGLAAYIEESQI